VPATIDLRRAVLATAQVNYAVSGSTRARVEVEGTVISEILSRRL